LCATGHDERIFVHFTPDDRHRPAGLRHHVRVMQIAAYVLAADPTWIRTSVLAYYAHVSRIVVSYDRDGRGWSGSPVPARRCIAALRGIDRDRKIRYVPGDFAGTHEDLMAAETAQRQAALDVAGLGADWVLQLDTDEVLPDAAALCRALADVGPQYEGVSWPMRVLYRRLRGGRYLEVAAEDGGLHVEYPGPVAVRAGVTLHHARHPAGPVLRVPVERPAGVVVDVAAAERAVVDVVDVVDVVALERGGAPAAVRTALADGGPDPRPPASREPCLTATADQVIWHNSWARSPRAVRRKVLSWGHGGPEMLEYYQHVWLPAPASWPQLRDLHPLHGPRWHHLRPAPSRPFPLARRDRPR
jgi:hypothetical protein